MANRLSNLLGVPHEDLESIGVFDGFVDIDSQLHIDPSLFENTKIPEFVEGRNNIQKYFSEVLTLIKFIEKNNDKFYRTAHTKLQFKEYANAGLGYSGKGTRGSAIGPRIAKKILDSAIQIIKAGIKDPLIFEIVGVFEEDMGPDRISDMTIAILMQDFLKYTERISKHFNITTQVFEIQGNKFSVPFLNGNNKPLIFLPKELLNSLPIALSWSDIDNVCAYNEAVRQRMNKIVGDNWKTIINKYNKKDLKQVLFDNPELLKDLIQLYKNKKKRSYDFKKDPLGEIIWAEITEHASSDHPLDLSKHLPLSADNIKEIVKVICEHYGRLLEHNGWFEYLYNDKGKQKPERAAQLLFMEYQKFIALLII